MNLLQTILFGDYAPPNVPGRPHRIGLTGGLQYVPPKVVKRVSSNLPNPSELKILKIVRSSIEPMSSPMVSKKAGYTVNHCGIILGALFKKGLVKRTKEISNGTRRFLYSPKV